MPETITFVYLGYMFVALYFLLLFTLTFVQNRKEMFRNPNPTRKYTVSVLVPAYNEEKSIEGTVNAILKTDYKGLLEIIIINDGSRDNTLKIAKRLEKKYPKVRVLNKKNSGKADSLNQAMKIARGELIAVVDADSYPDSHAISSMVGYFNDEKMGAVTTRVLVRSKINFMTKMQAIEYKAIAFTRKLLGFLDSIYVTPGPMALYRKTALKNIGGFDKRNMTEDIEATWHLIHDGYSIGMAFNSKSSTIVPDTLKKWFIQRIRWNIGGYQTILKYGHCFFRKGMLGLFILPFFLVSLLLGVSGLGIFFYRTTRRFLITYLSTSYSIESQTALLRLQEINLNPSVLNFFGIVLFILGMSFVFFSLRLINRHIGEKENFFIVIFYSLVYILLRPLVLIWSLIKFSTGKYSWR